MHRSVFITPSDIRWRRCRPLELLTTWRGCCAFESAWALHSGVVRGLETTCRQAIMTVLKRQADCGGDQRTKIKAKLQISIKFNRGSGSS
jgi:hypothetical protein